MCGKHSYRNPLFDDIRENVMDCEQIRYSLIDGDSLRHCMPVLQSIDVGMLETPAMIASQNKVRNSA